ncbi:MAG TPA: malto-oligosyltrehalose trehalohydrolase [Alphaproteobacteria bacterium]|nr:malto-oligosyltrehalose trehalohydrolase [Alphaproteobacteria bacterium]
MSLPEPSAMTSPQLLPAVGAWYLGDGRCRFRVWAPVAQAVSVHLVSPEDRLIPLEPQERGYYHGVIDGVEPGARYFYRLDHERDRPDPASRLQPEDVHGPSQVVDARFDWEEGCWWGLPLQDYLIYELHVGTFTPEGTFEAIIAHLPDLKALGITAIELMPVAQFPGSRNWGYDGVYLYAVQYSYGGPDGLKRLVNACHQQGLAVVLDVVYNHLGPEGNYLPDYGPYFTERYKTPWGAALNFDGPHSDEVRRFFIDNALFWVTEFHIDALRLDAVHAILDHSAFPFLEELGLALHARAERLNRRIYAIAESDLNDTRIVRPRDLGGFGLDAQWNDDFHHALRVVLTSEVGGYYQDFGELQQLAKAFREGYVYAGEYSQFRRRRHGNSSSAIPAQQFVVFAQNHDQVGNRMLGERLSQLVSFEGLKLAAAAVLLSPFIPLLFMGEEYGETAPFPYFISHLDAQLVEAVRRGRREEFASFAWQGEPPDPQVEATFESAKLQPQRRHEGHHRVLWEFYRELIQLRKTLPALSHLSKHDMAVYSSEQEQILCVRRWNPEQVVVLILHFGRVQASVRVPIPIGRWDKRLDSAEERWQGPGSPVAAELEADGEVSLTLPPEACFLFVRE